MLLQLEEQWYRRQSWSIEYHENLKRLQELHESEFKHNVEERNIKAARQRRWSKGKTSLKHLHFYSREDIGDDRQFEK